jgi:heme/copper-type cytochrome/quinol oxidase subunit 2
MKDALNLYLNSHLYLPLNVDLFTKYFFYFFTSYRPTNDSYSNNYILKSQYRPMRKGIINMVRLQANGAIAMPTEMRLHILASSKDVIHSWAIPSAGIKIDCVPGYSSHRIVIFLVHGIFWGQCMEICGRYHH